jgi:hypothetical protein
LNRLGTAEEDAAIVECRRVLRSERRSLWGVGQPRALYDQVLQFPERNPLGRIALEDPAEYDIQFRGQWQDRLEKIRIPKESPEGGIIH